MISRLGQAMPRFLAGTSVAGHGMRERLQTATFAMFGVVTAIGLVLVGIAYNQSWPDFADSPIPGIPTGRIDRATVAAGAAHGHAGSGGRTASHRSAPTGRSAVVPDRSSAPHGSSQQQLPTPAPGGPVPAPSGQGGVDVPKSHAPAGHAPAPAPPAPVAAQPAAPAAVPVAASPPAAEPADAASVPADSKPKGHEKAEKPAKPEKLHGKPAPVTPVVPTPSVPAPGATTEAPSPPAGPGNGSGKGNGKGHEK